MQTGLENIREICKRDNQKTRRQLAVAGIILLILLGIYFCTRTTELGFVSPVQVVKNIYTWAKLSLADLFDWSVYDSRRELIKEHLYYLETRGRVKDGISAVVMGAVISIAGVVFQCAFRNPIATPAMLGTSSGTRIANLIIVVQYSTLGINMVYRRYIYGYICCIAILLVLLLGARVMSKKRSSASDILLLGSVFSRIAGQVVNYIQAYGLDDSDYLALQEMNLYGVGSYSGALLTAVIIIAALVPLITTRMSLNVLCFGDEDAQSLGIRGPLLRGGALVCCTLLATTTLVQSGDVGLLAMLVPVVCRYIFGSDTRRLIMGSAIAGGILMLVCQMVASLFAFNEYLSVISTSVLVELVSAPLMIFVVYKNRRGWE